jgi:hypothetical protein
MPMCVYYIFPVILQKVLLVFELSFVLFQNSIIGPLEKKWNIVNNVKLCPQKKINELS